MYQYQSHVSRDIHPCTDNAQLRFGRRFHTLGLIEEKSRVKRRCFCTNQFLVNVRNLFYSLFLLLLENTIAPAITITKIKAWLSPSQHECNNTLQTISSYIMFKSLKDWFLRIQLILFLSNLYAWALTICTEISVKNFRQMVLVFFPQRKQGRDWVVPFTK